MQNINTSLFVLDKPFQSTIIPNWPYPKILDLAKKVCQIQTP
jgi:hypothetical protein